MDRKVAVKQLKFLKSKARNMRLAADGWRNHWQRLVAILLSARTRDEVTILVCEKMFEKFPTAGDFSKLDVVHIKRLIRNINFFENKARYLYNMTRDIVEKYSGKVPDSVDELITLQGVGRKTANVFLAQDGKAHIGVDTHVNYIANYLGWVDSEDPVKVEKQLENLFVKSMWKDVNNVLVSFGKTYTSRREKNMWLDYVLRTIK